MTAKHLRGHSRAIGVASDRNLALELIRVTEGAAIAAARLMGRNVKEEADQAAVDAMRQRLAHVDMDGVVVIGEELVCHPNLEQESRLIDEGFLVLTDWYGNSHQRSARMLCPAERSFQHQEARYDPVP